MIKTTISHLVQAKPKMVPIGQCLVSGEFCLPPSSLGIIVVTQRIYLPMRGMEGLFRGKNLTAGAVVLQCPQRAPVGRPNCLICGIQCKMDMQGPGQGQGSLLFSQASCPNSWLIDDSQRFPASQLPTQHSMVVGVGEGASALSHPEVA